MFDETLFEGWCVRVLMREQDDLKLEAFWQPGGSLNLSS